MTCADGICAGALDQHPWAWIQISIATSSDPFVSAPMPNQFGGHRRIAHGGGIDGFSSAIIRLPEPNVTAIVLANNESVNASAVGRDLLAIFYGERYGVQ
jgi:hypothetical protein